MAPRPPNKDGPQKTNLPFRMAVDTRSRHAGHASSSRSTAAAAPPEDNSAMTAAAASESKYTHAATERDQPNQTSSDGRSLALRAKIAPMYGRDGIDLADYVRDALVSPATPDGDNSLVRQVAENEVAIHGLQNSPEQGGRYDLTETNTKAAMILARKSNNVLMSYMAVAPELIPEGVHDLARLHFAKKAFQGQQSQHHGALAEQDGRVMVQPNQHIIENLLSCNKKLQEANKTQTLENYRLKEAHIRETQEKDAQIELLNAEIAKIKSQSAEENFSNEEASICGAHLRGTCRRGSKCKFVHLTDPGAFEHHVHLLDIEKEEKDAAAQKAAIENKKVD